MGNVMVPYDEQHGKNLYGAGACTPALPAGAMAAAPISTIAQGNTFSWVKGDWISLAAMGTDSQIGWWASAADIGTTSPS